MAATSVETPPGRQDSTERLTTAINRVSPRKVAPLTVRKYLRRLVTLVLWPSIDIIVTLFSNYLILRYNAFTGTSATILVMVVLNGALLYLLLLELDLSDWIRAKTARLEKIRRFVEATERRRNLVILLVYTLSGPTMAGVPARLAPIAVKLKGLTAYTTPSSGRYSMRFQTPFSDTG